MAGNDTYGTRFDGRMLPAMLHAYSIARATAMMCGSKAVQAEFQAHIDELLRQAGIPNLLRAVDEYAWHRASTALQTAKAFHWHTTRRWNEDDSRTSLIIDGREYELDHRFGSKTENLEAIKALLERYAHLDAVREPDIESGLSYKAPTPPSTPAETGDEMEDEVASPSP